MKGQRGGVREGEEGGLRELGAWLASRSFVKVDRTAKQMTAAVRREYSNFAEILACDSFDR